MNATYKVIAKLQNVQLMVCSIRAVPSTTLQFTCPVKTVCPICLIFYTKIRLYQKSTVLNDLLIGLIVNNIPRIITTYKSLNFNNC